MAYGERKRDLHIPPPPPGWYPVKGHKEMSTQDEMELDRLNDELEKFEKELRRDGLEPAPVDAKLLRDTAPQSLRPGMHQWGVRDAQGSIDLLHVHNEAAILVDGKFIIRRTTLAQALAHAKIRPLADRPSWQEAVALQTGEYPDE